MLFQETTPDTSAYMIAGYTIAFLLMGIYVLSLFIRSRNLQRELQILEELRAGQPAADLPPARPAKKAVPPARKSKTATKNK